MVLPSLLLYGSTGSHEGPGASVLMYKIVGSEGDDGTYQLAVEATEFERAYVGTFKLQELADWLENDSDYLFSVAPAHFVEGVAESSPALLAQAFEEALARAEFPAAAGGLVLHGPCTLGNGEDVLLRLPPRGALLEVNAPADVRWVAADVAVGALQRGVQQHRHHCVAPEQQLQELAAFIAALPHDAGAPPEPSAVADKRKHPEPPTDQGPAREEEEGPPGTVGVEGGAAKQARLDGAQAAAGPSQQSSPEQPTQPTQQLKPKRPGAFRPRGGAAAMAGRQRKRAGHGGRGAGA